MVVMSEQLEPVIDQIHGRNLERITCGLSVEPVVRIVQRELQVLDELSLECDSLRVQRCVQLAVRIYVSLQGSILVDVHAGHDEIHQVAGILHVELQVVGVSVPCGFRIPEHCRDLFLEGDAHEVLHELLDSRASLEFSFGEFRIETDFMAVFLVEKVQSDVAYDVFSKPVFKHDILDVDLSAQCSVRLLHKVDICREIEI